MLKTTFVLLAAGIIAFAGTPASAQTPDPLRIPPQRVTVFKDAEDAQKLPASVTAVTGSMIDLLGANSLNEASIYAPNTFFSEFTARKLSNPVFRGIGSGPTNPGVTTYLDGAPQLNTNSSSIELLDIDQVEYARGPFSALYGRNTLGGVINVTSKRPSLGGWKGNFTTTAASHSEWDERASVTGPLTSTLGFSLTAGAGGRDGYTVNDITGHTLDDRFAVYGKSQLLWAPSRDWETRVIVTGERARDGDYALNDVGSLRTNPFHASRDFEGETRRDVFSIVALNRVETGHFTITTNTGLVYWKTFDETDLDYTAGGFGQRRNSEKDFQFTQEARLAAKDAVHLGSNLSLKWQVGEAGFSQRYDQSVINIYAPGVVDIGSVAQISPAARLNDLGFSLFGQATVSYKEKVDVVATVRGDREEKKGDMITSSSPSNFLFPVTTSSQKRVYQSASPDLAVMYHFDPAAAAYVSIGRGFKAGGFNPVSPTGNESYNEETAWHVEAGAKANLARDRVTVSSSWFVINWNDLQFYEPVPSSFNQFYVLNIGGARSKGAEFEIKARPIEGVDFFSIWGVTRARFDNGTVLNSVNVSGNFIPNTPTHTFTWGTDVTRKVARGWAAYGHFDTRFSGGFMYNGANTGSQAPYSLTTFRAGTRGRKSYFEAWVKNASDTRYIPIAFTSDPTLAPSGFLGEMGAPRTYGFRAGLDF